MNVDDMPSNYREMCQALGEAHKWAKDGFPGATLEDLIRITSPEPEWTLAAIRLRADRNCWKLLKGIPK